MLPWLLSFLLPFFWKLGEILLWFRLTARGQALQENTVWVQLPQNSFPFEMGSTSLGCVRASCSDISVNQQVELLQGVSGGKIF